MLEIIWTLNCHNKFALVPIFDNHLTSNSPLSLPLNKPIWPNQFIPSFEKVHHEIPFQLIDDPIFLPPEPTATAKPAKLNYANALARGGYPVCYRHLVWRPWEVVAPEVTQPIAESTLHCCRPAPAAAGAQCNSIKQNFIRVGPKGFSVLCVLTINFHVERIMKIYFTFATNREGCHFA